MSPRPPPGEATSAVAVARRERVRRAVVVQERRQRDGEKQRGGPPNWACSEQEARSGPSGLRDRPAMARAPPERRCRGASGRRTKLRRQRIPGLPGVGRAGRGPAASTVWRPGTGGETERWEEEVAAIRRWSPARPRRGETESSCSMHAGRATWLILPVVICLSQRLSHACASMNASAP